MEQKSIPQKRNLLYEMVLKLSGLDKRIMLTHEEITQLISKTRANYESFSTNFSLFIQKFMNDMPQYLKDKFQITNIENLPLLETTIQNIKDMDLMDSILKGLQSNLIDLLNNHIQTIKGSEIEKPANSLASDQTLQYLLIYFNRLDKTLNKMLSSESVDQIERYTNLIGEILTVLNRISNLSVENETFEDILSKIKEINTILKYKKNSVSFALILRGFRDGRIQLKKFKYLLNTKIRSEIIRGTIIFTLRTFGTLTIDQIAEKTHLDPEELVENCVSLLDRKDLTETFSNNNYFYDQLREHPKFHTFISKVLSDLKKSHNKLSISAHSLLTAVVSIVNSILDKTLKIGSETDKIYSTEVAKLTELLDKFNASIKSKRSEPKLKYQNYRISALMELYNMFRVKMIHEKEPYLIEQSLDEDRQKQLENYLLTAIKMDFERGLILSILKTEGPSNILELAKLSNIPSNKVLRHILKLEHDKNITIIGPKDNYFLYDVPRSLTEFETAFQNILNPFINLVKAYIIISKQEPYDLENLTIYSTSLITIVENLIIILKLEIDSDLKVQIKEQLDRAQLLLNQCKQLESKLPKTKSQFDLTKLAVMPLPYDEGATADLIEPKYLVGFGDIEWDVNKCLACASCQVICPEAAVILKNEWDLRATFEMSDDLIEALPENRRNLIQLIKKLAIKKPSKSIKLPQNTLGFGTVDYNPLICIACRKCEERCPNNALTFQEFWNFPQIMKNLLNGE